MKFLLFILMFCTSSTFAAPIAEIEGRQLPFWRGNAKVWDRITDHRDIVVLVKSEEVKSAQGEKRLIMQGIGIVNIPAKKAFALTKDFEHLSTLSKHIRDVKFNKKKMQVFMHTEAYKYEARMLMDVKFDVATKAKRIRFRIVQGVLRGLTGVVSFRDLQHRRAQISLQVEFAYKKLPMPKLFLEFGLELVLQQIAAKIRTYVEANRLKGSSRGGA